MTSERTKRTKTETLLYGLLKNAARDSFIEFLEDWDLTEEDWDEIKKDLVTKLEINGANIYL